MTSADTDGQVERHSTGGDPVTISCRYWQSSMRLHDRGCSCWCGGLRPVSLGSDRAQRALRRSHAARPCKARGRQVVGLVWSRVSHNRGDRDTYHAHEGLRWRVVVKPACTDSVHRALRARYPQRPPGTQPWRGW
jgi:hypothetical protein